MKYVGEDLAKLLYSSGTEVKSFISMEIDGEVAYRQQVYVTEVDHDTPFDTPQSIRARIVTTGVPAVPLKPQETEGAKFHREIQEMSSK